MRRLSEFFFLTRPLLESLDEADNVLFKQYLRTKRIKKGKELFREGSYPKSVHIIKKGKIKLSQYGHGGVETIVYLYSAGEMLGYRPLLSDARHPATAIAIEESTVLSLPARQFLVILAKSASFSNVLLRMLSHEFTALINRIGAFSQKSVKERTALSLLILREKYRKPENDGKVEIGLSRSDLAAFVGTSVETIARIISQLKEDKIITTLGRKIVIQNEQALYQLME